MNQQEARDDERKALIAELHGVTVAFGDMSPIGNLARRARKAIEAQHPEPEPGVSFDPPYRIEYIDGGDAVLLPFRVIDCAGNVRSLVLTAERAAEMREAINKALTVFVSKLDNLG